MRSTGARAYYRPTPPKMPPGLVELMEGLTKEVLRHSPTDVYGFCAGHMQQLLQVRDGPPNKKLATLEEKISKAQDKIRQRAERRRQEYDKTFNSVPPNNNTEEKNVTNVTAELTADTPPTLNVLKPPVHHEEELNQSSETDISPYVNSEGNEEGKQIIQSENVQNIDDAEGCCNKTAKIENEALEKVKAQNIDENQANIFNENNDNIHVSIEINKEPETKKQELDVQDTINNESIINSKNCEGKSENHVKNSTMMELTQGFDDSSKSHNQHVHLTELETNTVNDERDESYIPILHQKRITESEIDNINVESECKNDNKEKTNEAEISSTFPENEDETTACHGKVGDEGSLLVIGEEIQHDTNGVIDLSRKDEALPDNKGVSSLFKINEEMQTTNSDDTMHIFSMNTAETGRETSVAEDDLSKNNADIQKNCVSSDVSIFSDKDEKYKGISSDMLANCKDKEVNIFLTETQLPRNENEIHSAQETINDLKKEHDTFKENSLKASDEFKTTHDEPLEMQANAENSNTFFSDPGEREMKIDHSLNQDDPNKHNVKSSSVTNNIVEDGSHNIQSTELLDSTFNTIEHGTTQNDTSTLLHEHASDETHDNNMDLETAAVTIQKVFRSFLFKSRTSTLDDTPNDDDQFSDEDNDKKEEDYPIVSSLSKERRPHGITRMDTVLQTVNEEKSLSLSTDDSSTLSSAATIIQAHVRGFLVRNKLNSNKTHSLAASNSHDRSITSLENDNDQQNKTILNIHIVPEGNYLSRDESLITSIDLSLDGSPPSSINLHPLGYDRTERRKQLKREDAIQSISPPSNNSGKLSEDVDSVKELLNDDNVVELKVGDAMAHNNVHQEINSNKMTNLNGNDSIETAVETTNNLTENTISEMNTSPNTQKEKSLSKMSSDEMDVVTPFASNESNDSTETKLMHSGEFHDAVLPTRVSRTDTAVVREFKNVLVYFLLWNHS